MKKLMKRIIPLVLIVVMCVCMAAPAFADSTVPAAMSGFPKKEMGSVDNYVGVIQRFLYWYNNDTIYYIQANGGVDCSFGSGTYQAVMAFQRDTGLTIDGVVGINTWKKFGNKMISETIYNSSDINYGYYLGNEALHVVLRLANLSSSGKVQTGTKWYYLKTDNGSPILFRTES